MNSKLSARAVLCSYPGLKLKGNRSACKQRSPSRKVWMNHTVIGSLAGLCIGDARYRDLIGVFAWVMRQSEF